jgi:hypothetical protein
MFLKILIDFACFKLLKPNFVYTDKKCLHMMHIKNIFSIKDKCANSLEFQRKNLIGKKINKSTKAHARL